MASRLPPLQNNWGSSGRSTEPQEGDTPSRGNTRMLIQRASELKNSIVTHMLEDDGYSGGVWYDRHLRALLQEHLHTVTTALTKLGHDIESVESQLTGRDQATAVNNTVMRNLEVQQATSVNDLRSRVARCDANISVLSGDMRKMFDSLSSLTLQMQNVMGNQGRTEKLLEEKISNLGENSERQRSDHSARLRSSEDKFQLALDTLDSKLKSLIQETQHTVESIRVQGSTTQVKLEREMTQSMESARARRDKKVDDLEESLVRRMAALEKRMEEMELEQRESKLNLASDLQSIRDGFQESLHSEAVGTERRLRALLEEFRRENDEGLNSLGESLKSLRAVLEGKQTLLAEELRAEMAKMKKLVVVT